LYRDLSLQKAVLILNGAGPEGFDPSTCGSEDRRDILTTLRALPRDVFRIWSISIELLILIVNLLYRKYCFIMVL
jgi:hypothetical protein